ncbi:MAG: hypothetical protein LWY06_19540 [Firmicutes bacterium]|nr:hypothetical protein [Bacillota bacterium]
MPDVSQIKCPKCRSALLLKFAKKDGIQCKKCYYFIPLEEMNEIIGKEEQKVRDREAAASAATEAAGKEASSGPEKKSTRCPKCRTEVEYTKLTDGGIMCKRCYHWIKVEGAEEELLPGQMKPYSPPVIPYTPPSRENKPVKQAVEETEVIAPVRQQEMSGQQAAAQIQEPAAVAAEPVESAESLEEPVPVYDEQEQAYGADTVEMEYVAEDQAPEAVQVRHYEDESELFPVVEVKKKNLYSVDESLLDEIMNPQGGQAMTVMEMVPEIEIEFEEEEGAVQEEYYAGAGEIQEEVYYDESELQAQSAGEDYIEESVISEEIPIVQAVLLQDEPVLPEQPPEIVIETAVETPEKVSEKVKEELQPQQVVIKPPPANFRPLPKPPGTELKKIQSMFSSRTFDIKKIAPKPPGNA